MVSLVQSRETLNFNGSPNNARRLAKMQNADILALAGLRVDGRKFDEIRRIQCNIGIYQSADGSAYLEQVFVFVSKS